MISIAGKRALVTGAAGGIGRCISRALLEAGCELIISGRNRTKLEALSAELKAVAPSAVTPLVMDLEDHASVVAAFAEIEAQFQRLDILVNNAGAFPICPVADGDPADFAKTINTNVLGSLYAMQSAIGLMRKNGVGDIVNITSEGVRRVPPMMAVYAGSKAALEVISEGARDELKGEDIRVSVLRSGHVVHDNVGEGAADWTEEKTREWLEKSRVTGYEHFTGVGIRPEITAASVVHLLTLAREARIDLLELRSV